MVSKKLDPPEYILNKEFKKIGILGEGSYGNVFEVLWRLDRDRPRHSLAMKCIRPEFERFAEHEINILRKIEQFDPLDTSCCIKLIRHIYDDDEHLYLVFPKLGDTLHVFRRSGGTLTFDQFRHIAFQLLTAISFLHQHSIIHADIKPDNILLMDSTTTENEHGKKLLQNTAIRLIDFGVSLDLTQVDPDQVKTVQYELYRAPEITLKTRYGKPIDVWCTGCLLFGLFRNKDMINKGSDTFRLGIMEKVLGKFPSRVIEESPRKDYLFDGTGNVTVSEHNRARIDQIRKPLKEYDTTKTEESEQLFDLMQKLLDLDRNTRITAEEALDHPYFHIKREN